MIRVTHEDGSSFIVNEMQIETIIDTANGTMIQIIGKPNSCFIVKETIDEIEDMILLDQLAMSAMNGMLSNSSLDEIGAKGISHDAYLFADEMLKQRKVK